MFLISTSKIENRQTKAKYNLENTRLQQKPLTCLHLKVLIGLTVLSNGIKITPISKASKENVVVFAVFFLNQMLQIISGKLFEN